MGALKHGSQLLRRNPIEIYQDEEPAAFTSCFHGWVHWSMITKHYIDPRQVRLDMRKRMGLLGDMVTIMGRPVAGISSADSKLRAKIIQQRRTTIQFSENVTDMIRERVRLQVIKNIKEASTRTSPKKHLSQILVKSTLDSSTSENLSIRSDCILNTACNSISACNVICNPMGAALHIEEELSPSKALNSSPDEINKDGYRERIRSGPLHSPSFQTRRSLLPVYKAKKISNDSNLAKGNFAQSVLKSKSPDELKRMASSIPRYMKSKSNVSNLSSK